MALLAQPGQRLLQRPGLVQGPLAEVDVEDDAELRQRGLDLGEHELDAARPEDRQLLVVGPLEQAGLGRDDLGGDVVDVGPGVTVLGHRLPLRGRLQAPGEPVDLGAGVVEVVLPRHLGAAGLQQPAERVTDRGPPGAADVHRAGRVGRDELEVDPLPGQRLRAPVGLAGGDRLDRDLPQRALGEGDVQEARPGDVDGGDRGLRAQLLGQRLGHGARRDARGLGQPHRDVGGVVAVGAVLRPLDDDVVGHLDGERPALDGPAHSGPDDVAQLLGCHRGSVLTAAPAPGGPPRRSARLPGCAQAADLDSASEQHRTGRPARQEHHQHRGEALAKDRTPDATRPKSGGAGASRSGKGGRTRPPVNVVAPQRPWGLIAAAVAVVVFAVAVIGYAVVQVNEANADKVESIDEIAGITTAEYEAGQHVAHARRLRRVAPDRRRARPRLGRLHRHRLRRRHPARERRPQPRARRGLDHLQPRRGLRRGHRHAGRARRRRVGPHALALRRPGLPGQPAVVGPPAEGRLGRRPADQAVRRLPDPQPRLPPRGRRQLREPGVHRRPAAGRRGPGRPAP